MVNRDVDGAYSTRSKIKDSGSRTEFDSGAVRDIQEGKGRFDLLPLNVIYRITQDGVIDCIGVFKQTGSREDLASAFETFVVNEYGGSSWQAIKDLALHFERGAKKYGERNWEKGIPISRYMDSALRHYVKHKNGETDEPHGVAFMWNILCALETLGGISKISEEWGK